MTTSKFAAIHGGLLARKGQASPAIPSPLPYVSYTDEPMGEPIRESLHEPMRKPPVAPSAGRRDVEQQFDRPLMASKPIEEVEVNPINVADETDEGEQACCGLADGLNAIPVCETPLDVEDNKPRFRVTLRMTAEQRRRLRTVAAAQDLSLQHVLSDALDAYLDRLATREMKGCACLSRKLASG